MSEAARPSDLEALLRRALAPVEPPADLAARLESTLTTLTEAAAEELDAWELSAMRDPRNWVRPVAAAVPIAAAGAGLVVLRVAALLRRHAQGRSPGQLADVAERALREVFNEARRVGR